MHSFAQLNNRKGQGVVRHRVGSLVLDLLQEGRRRTGRKNRSQRKPLRLVVLRSTEYGNRRCSGELCGASGLTESLTLLSSSEDAHARSACKSSLLYCPSCTGISSSLKQRAEWCSVCSSSLVPTITQLIDSQWLSRILDNVSLITDKVVLFSPNELWKVTLVNMSLGHYFASLSGSSDSSLLLKMIRYFTALSYA